MKAHIATAALVLASASAFAQTTGVSNPEPAPITTTDDSAQVITPKSAQAKPSAGTLIAAPASAPAPAAPAAPEVVYGPYVPYKGPMAASAVADKPAPADDPDAMIVTSVPEREGELHEGTLLRTRVLENISTTNTPQGTRFSAELTEPIERNGRVVLPAGAILEGRITQVHGGSRITGGAALHLETHDILLPDGTHYIVHAQLVDTSRNGLKVNNEGTIKRAGDAKQTAVILGGVTGAGAVTGAVIGGGVGAVVGASIGAGVSTVLWLREDRQATLPKDAGLVFSLTTPMILTPLTNTPGGGLNTHEGNEAGAAQ